MNVHEIDGIVGFFGILYWKVPKTQFSFRDSSLSARGSKGSRETLGMPQSMKFKALTFPEPEKSDSREAGRDVKATLGYTRLDRIDKLRNDRGKRPGSCQTIWSRGSTSLLRTATVHYSM